MLVCNTERRTKTRAGEKAQAGQRKFPPMAVATGTDRCPVKLYKVFASRRSDSMKLADSPFLLQVKTKGWEENQVWYYPTPWGQKQCCRDINEGKICHWFRNFHRESL